MLRVGPEMLVVVGAVPQDPDGLAACVSISVGIYRSALHRLSGEPYLSPPGVASVAVIGTPVVDPVEMRLFGVGPGEAAVRISEPDFRARSAGQRV